MRLDKFLKVSRLIKRRTVANEISDTGRVYVNGNIAKPAKILKVGDVIKIEYANIVIKITPSIGRNSRPMPLGSDKIKSLKALTLSFSKTKILSAIRIVFFAI